MGRGALRSHACERGRQALVAVAAMVLVVVEVLAVVGVVAVLVLAPVGWQRHASPLARSNSDLDNLPPHKCVILDPGDAKIGLQPRTDAALATAHPPPVVLYEGFPDEDPRVSTLGILTKFICWLSI